MDDDFRTMVLMFRTTCARGAAVPPADDDGVEVVERDHRHDRRERLLA